MNIMFMVKKNKFIKQIITLAMMPSALSGSRHIALDVSGNFTEPIYENIFLLPLQTLIYPLIFFTIKE